MSGAVLSAGVDLDAYFRRIGYPGPREPSLPVLRALQACHVAAVPFEAIDVLLGRQIDLAPAAVDAKLIGSRRGGYCFEHNSLFKRVLEAIGFEVDALIARVRWMAAPDAPLPPRTHMALRVPVEGEAWLVDVGFGACVPTEPLRIESRKPQPTEHETFRIAVLDGELLVQAQLGGRWEAMYQFAPDPQQPADFETANWFTSTHPASHFRHRLTAALATPEARYSLHGSRFRVRRRDGTVEEHVLDGAGVERVLGETFGISASPEWRPILERAISENA